MTHFKKSALLFGTALTAVPFFASSALAQDAQDPAQAQGGSLTFDEIVVTAQRRSESVLDVPLSIQAMSEEQLTNSGISQVSDLQLTTPGFVPGNSSGYNQMFIRGVGNAIFVGADPSVATFIDDVPRVFGTLVNNFVDVERVEVIKGAPGALYGRNATGGAVNIITRQPDPTQTSGKVKASYGEMDTFKTSAFVNLPLGEKAAMTLAGEYSKHDGYVENITPTPLFTADMFPVNGAAGPGTASFVGTPAQTAAFFNSSNARKDSYADENFYAVSGKFMVMPTETLKITLAGDFSEKDDDSGNGLYNTSPAYAVGSLSGFLNSVAGASTTVGTLSDLIIPVTGKFETAQAGEGYVRLKDYGFSGTAVLELPGVDLTSITAYRENKSRFFTELGFTPFNYLAARVNIDKSTLYQEFRAVSNLDGPLSYLAGVSYLKAKFDGGLTTTLLNPLAPDLPSGSGRYTVENWSGYLQVGYDVTENLNITVAGRYIHETNDAISVNPLAGNAESQYNLKEKKFLPSATIRYDLAGGGNIYARWARGFKAGGIVPVVPVAVFDAPSTPEVETEGGVFKGEEIDTYEVGIRTPLFDRRVQFTAALFYNDYRNVHTAAHADPSFPNAGLISIAVVNGQSARSYGAEATVNARMTDAITVGGSAGYLNAKYKDFVLTQNPVLAPFDLSGQRMINSPEWQLSAHANLDQPINDNLNLIGNLLVSYTDDIVWFHTELGAGEAFLPDVTTPSTIIVNARAGIRSADDAWELAAYAKNLFNEANWSFGSAAGAYGNELAWGQPRVIGLEAIFNF